MSSYFDEASLVMIPSGYKNQKVYSIKPLDGAGDLTFSRASSATRVASNGLIEKVRTNLLLQSNTFSTTWANDNTTETSGQAGYDGTNNAWLISKSASGGSIYQTGLSSSSLQTFSLYAKQGTSTWISMTILGGSNPRTSFDLVNGVVGTLLGGAISAKIESVGNGWYRCSVVASVSGSGVYIYPSEGDGVTTATSGTLIIQNAQLEASDIATAYIATTTAAVSVGPVSGLPRLDYLNSTCPRLLLEPQRTNLATYSEQANQYTKVGATIGSNVVTSPDGYTNADSIIEDGSTGGHAFYNFGITTFTAAAYTASVFAKKGGRDWFALSLYDGTQGFTAFFNLNTGVVGTITGVGTSTITNYGNGWYRCTITATTAAGSTGGIAVYSANADGTTSYAGTNGLAAGYFYGWQLELGAYATSYIPTLGTSVTRVADAASKTGIGSLIGQTEGTLFVDFVWKGHFATYQSIEIFGNSTNRIGIYGYETTNTFRWFIFGSGSVPFENNITSSLVIGQRYKIAIAYKSGDSAAYVNGTQTFASSATFTFNNALNDLYYRLGSGVDSLFQPISQNLLFKTRLTNAQLAELTTL
jgi:hypothetical protein